MNKIHALSATVVMAVAAVVAQTRAQAEDAVEQVAVGYDELPAVISLGDAMKPGAPQVASAVPGNVAAEMSWGDKKKCEAAFAQAKHITKLSLHNQRLIPVTMEPRGTVAEFDKASGRVTVHTSCQNPAGLQKALAESIRETLVAEARQAA